MQRSPFLLPSALAFALAAVLSTPTRAQSAKAELYIDVATHASPGMPGGGVMGRLAGSIGGFKPGYGMARHPALPGRYLDVALHNPRQPGAPASQAIPKDLRLGKQLELLPAAPAPARDEAADGNANNQAIADGGPYRVRYYWGCGEQARKGQPAEYSLTIRNGKPVQGGRVMKPRQVTQRGVDPGPGHVLWPNPSHGRTVASRASLVGTHHVTGAGLPASMQFDLARDQDFMPALELDAEGSAEKGVSLHWNGIDGARAYFIHATVMDGDTIVMWSSSEDGYAGLELMDYLPESQVRQWTGKRTLLGADARSCQVPREVLAGSDGAPMLQMIAYGGERTVAGPEWNVRLRNKSTAMLMLGSDGTATTPGKAAAKGLLRGLIGR